MGKVTLFIFLLLFVLSFLIVCLFFISRNTHTPKDTAPTLTSELMEEAGMGPTGKRTSTCQFGFGFIEELAAKTSYTEPKKLMLPEHKKVNFSGALISQDFLCLDTMDATENQPIGIFECHGLGRNQEVKLTTEGFIRNGKSGKSMCVATKNMVSQAVVMKQCNHQDNTQFWTTDAVNGFIKPIIRQDHCLHAPMKEEETITIQPCKEHTKSLKWKLVMKEVLQLWIQGLPSHMQKRHENKEKGTRQMKDLMIQNKAQTRLDPFFI